MEPKVEENGLSSEKSSRRSRTFSLTDDKTNQTKPQLSMNSEVTRRLSHDALLRQDTKLFEMDWKLDPSKIKLGKLIGQGAFGKVYKADYLGTTVCVKIGNPSIQQIEDFKREIKILSSLRHPNVVLFMGISHGERGELYLVQEYVSGGPLNKVLKKQHIPLLLKIKMAYEIAQAINYLHYHSVLHRDLKGENILLDNNSSIKGDQLNFRCKVADFGLAKLIDYSNPNYILENVGTPWWRAPEVLTGKYDFSADIFSFGVVLGEIFLEDAGEDIRISMTKEVKENGQLLFISKPEMLKHHYPEPYKFYPKDILLLMEQCCNQDPNDRPTSAIIVNILRSLYDSYKHYSMTVKVKIEDQEGIDFWMNVANPHFSLNEEPLGIPSKDIVEGVKQLIKKKTTRELDLNQETFLYHAFFKQEIYTLQDFAENFWFWFSQIFKVITEKKVLPLWNEKFIEGFISKEDAYKLLETSSNGTFIIRFSLTQPMSLVFSCKFTNRCSCILVQVQNSEFKLKNRIYNTIAELLTESSLHEMVFVYPNIPWNGAKFSAAHSAAQRVIVIEDIKRHKTGYQE